ncbi:DEAD/DEAH box helicase family protein [Nodularia sp. UHCC 0506]|uniref:DEAD/DEAH box helicase family protein n=1 Tax=Nodularia sp. UHCC 0506 TaxID=3110243 RepID=UPI002B21D861|nr:DEAD/DEAH box helicase family protein [Nodularia sp. UHCC 0506]MEA5513292.1 DEAD/DEAH box helicase family protein [Nodularia sp. UHCC 0506]
MVDFKKLLASQNQQVVIEPTEIFRRLPKPPGINDLYTSQDQVLKEWFERRKERDIVIKLHTGGGKTLVALLIAQSILNEHRQPVIYLSPTNQIVQQTLDKAKEYSIPAVAYDSNANFPEDFLAAKKVLICNYQVLFNGRSKFGVRDSSRIPISLGAIILDDAHVAFSTIRQQFTLKVEREEEAQDNYNYLTNIFRNDFNTLGKAGTFDDIVSGIDSGILEVPYWSWQAKSSQIRGFLRTQSDSYPFVWTLLRDNFDYCHCLISRKAFVITPIFPLVDLIPTFIDCPHRIFMSATISDDSAIIRTFDADYASVAKPITSNSLAGVSERMILAPELMSPMENMQQILQNMAKWMAEEQKEGTVILVSSDKIAKLWTNVAKFPDSTEKVAIYVKELQDGKSHGPFVFANRYDGIDLSNSSCRLLIISGLPFGSSEYEQHRANTFAGASELSSALAQRIEQGMGRGARGAGDYCVVILTGNDIAAWLGRCEQFLTKITRAQFQMGQEISKSIVNKKDLHETIMKCLARDIDWIEYHAKSLADLTESIEQEQSPLSQANIERKAFQLIRTGYFDKAISKLEGYWQNTEQVDLKSRGWLKQLTARAAHYWGRTDLSQRYQQQAYADNSSLLRPQIIPPYVQLTTPGKQAEAIVNQIISYKGLKRGYLGWFNQEVSQLVPESSANQFEQGLERLGSTLGFCAERPEKIYGIGPDVLWLLNENLGLVIEAKSRKYPQNPLNKDNFGQLLTSVEWFKKEYPNYQHIAVSVHQNINTTKAIVINDDSKALTQNKLNQLITDTRILLEELCESNVPNDELVIKCEDLLNNSSLKPEIFIEEYLVLFA